MGVCGDDGSDDGRKDLCTLITNMHGYRYRYDFPFPLFFTFIALLVSWCVIMNGGG